MTPAQSNRALRGTCLFLMFALLAGGEETQQCKSGAIPHNQVSPIEIDSSSVPLCCQPISLRKDQLPAGRSLAGTAAQDLSDGALVDYTDFDGNVVQRRRFNGVHVAFLVRPGQVNDLGIAWIRRQIDRYDRIYAHMKELLGTEPLGDGLLTIAVIDQGPAGRGILGFKATEVIHLLFTPDQLLYDLLYQVVVHEMAHNFDRFGGTIFVEPDAAHSWTTFLHHYEPVYDREGFTDEDSVHPDDYLRQKANLFMGNYLSAPNRSWELCVRDILCGDVQIAIQTQGALILRIAQVYGPTVIKRFYPLVRDVVQARGLTGNMTKAQKNDLLIETLSMATGHNLSCFVDSIQWAASNTLRAALAASFPASPFCNDADQDGYSPFLGDFRDDRSSVYPGADEIIDGLDNDLNGIIDDELLLETSPFPNFRENVLTVSIPVKIRGHVIGFTQSGGFTPEENDFFQVNLSGPKNVAFELRAFPGFHGSIWVFHQNSNTVLGARLANSDVPVTRFSVPLGPGIWKFRVSAGENGTGDYELLVWENRPRVDPGLIAKPPVEVAGGALQLAAPFIPADVGSQPDPAVRFWVSQVGWVGTTTLQAPAGFALLASPTLTWNPPTGTDLKGLQYIFQFFNNGVPATAASISAPLGPASTTGVFRPSNGALFLKQANTTGFADRLLTYGLPGDRPVTGDWDGVGGDTIGVFRNGTFLLRDSNTNGFANVVFTYGVAGDLPIAGDWNGNGIGTVGVFRNGLFMLRNSNSSGPPDVVFSLGMAGDIPIAGDWDGDGTDTVGVFRPSTGALFLKNSNNTGFADIYLTYGLPGDKPVTGDWNADGIDTIGVYRGGTFLLRDSNTNGFAELVFSLGVASDIPISGDWDGLP